MSTRPITPRMKWAIYSFVVGYTTAKVDHREIAKISFDDGKEIIGHFKGGLIHVAAMKASEVLHMTLHMKPGSEWPKTKDAPKDAPEPQAEPKDAPEEPEDDEGGEDEPEDEPEDEAEPEKKPRAKDKGGDAVEKKLKELTALLKAQAEKNAKPKKPEGIPGAVPRTPDYIPPRYFSQVCHVVKNGGQVLLSGPAGCGKSRLACEVAKVLDTPYNFLPVGGGVRYRQIFGGDQIVNGETRWEPGPLLRWIQEPGIILIDEIFGADPDVLLGLNPLLEPSTRSIQTPIGEIKVHQDCRIMAAANTLGRQASHRQYTGAQRADDSLLDRFLVQPCEYEPEVEKKIVEGLGLDTKCVSDLMARAASLREKIKTNQIAFDVSTRRIIQAARLLLQGLNMASAIALAITNSLTETERTRVE